MLLICAEEACVRGIFSQPPKDSGTWVFGILRVLRLSMRSWRKGRGGGGEGWVDDQHLFVFDMNMNMNGWMERILNERWDTRRRQQTTRMAFSFSFSSFCLLFAFFFCSIASSIVAASDGEPGEEEAHASSGLAPRYNQKTHEHENTRTYTHTSFGAKHGARRYWDTPTRGGPPFFIPFDPSFYGTCNTRKGTHSACFWGRGRGKRG